MADIIFNPVNMFVETPPPVGVEIGGIDSVSFDVGGGGGGYLRDTWDTLRGKPFERIGENLKVVNGTLSVDTAPNVEQDNTKPITSAAVYVEVGNINALLELI